MPLECHFGIKCLGELKTVSTSLIERNLLEQLLDIANADSFQHVRPSLVGRVGHVGVGSPPLSGHQHRLSSRGRVGAPIPHSSTSPTLQVAASATEVSFVSVMTPSTSKILKPQPADQRSLHLPRPSVYLRSQRRRVGRMVQLACACSHQLTYHRSSSMQSMRILARISSYVVMALAVLSRRDSDPNRLLPMCPTLPGLWRTTRLSL